MVVKHLAPLKAKEQYKYIWRAPKFNPSSAEAKTVAASVPGRFVYLGIQLQNESRLVPNEL